MRTLSITMQINNRTMGIFPDPSVKEYADLITMARNIAIETWNDVELLICEQYGPGPFDVEWKIMRFTKRDGEVIKTWELDQEVEE